MLETTNVYGNKMIMETMTVKLFEKLRSVFHFALNDDALPREHGHDMLHKIRYIMKELQK